MPCRVPVYISLTAIAEELLVLTNPCQAWCGSPQLTASLGKDDQIHVTAGCSPIVAVELRQDKKSASLWCF